MEKIKSNYDHKDYMRMAMLKHEETFKEQVYELHRLYRMQKMLMQNVAQSQQKQERFLVDNSNKGFTIDYNHQEAGQMSHLSHIKSHQSNISIMGLHGPENDQVLRSGGPIERPHNTQQHIEESNTNNVNSVLDESEIELTLSLGPSTRNPRRRKTESGHESFDSSSTGSSQTWRNNTGSLLARGGRRQFTWGSSSDFPQGSDLEPSFSNGPPNNNSPWLFQALSLKTT